jgi:cell division ATPase FtsA
MLPGLVEVAEAVFDAPVRIGTPNESEEVAQPGFATAVGLVLYGCVANKARSLSGSRVANRKRSARWRRA